MRTVLKDYEENFSAFYCDYLFICVRVHLCEGQRTTLEAWISPSTI